MCTGMREVKVAVLIARVIVFETVDLECVIQNNAFAHEMLNIILDLQRYGLHNNSSGNQMEVLNNKKSVRKFFVKNAVTYNLLTLNGSPCGTSVNPAVLQ